MINRKCRYLVVPWFIAFGVIAIGCTAGGDSASWQVKQDGDPINLIEKEISPEYLPQPKEPSDQDDDDMGPGSQSPIAGNGEAVRPDLTNDQDDHEQSAVESEEDQKQTAPIVGRLNVTLENNSMNVTFLPGESENTALPTVTALQVIWVGKNEVRHSMQLSADQPANVTLAKPDGGSLPDGEYRYEVFPVVSPIIGDAAGFNNEIDFQGRDAQNQQVKVRQDLPQRPRHSGAFTIAHGLLVEPVSENGQKTSKTLNRK